MGRELDEWRQAARCDPSAAVKGHPCRRGGLDPREHPEICAEGRLACVFFLLLRIFTPLSVSSVYSVCFLKHLAPFTEHSMQLSISSCVQVDARTALNTYSAFRTGGSMIGEVGFCVNVSNTLAAVFMATGQDVAGCTESCAAQLVLCPASSEEIQRRGEKRFSFSLFSSPFLSSPVLSSPLSSSSVAAALTCNHHSSPLLQLQVLWQRSLQVSSTAKALLMSPQHLPAATVSTAVL